MQPIPRKEKHDEQRPEFQEPQARHGQSRAWHHQAHLQLHLPVQVACHRIVVCILVGAAAQAGSALFLQSLIDTYILPMVGESNSDWAPLLRAIS